jgi:hypothetical protein
MVGYVYAVGFFWCTFIFGFIIGYFCFAGNQNTGARRARGILAGLFFGILSPIIIAYFFGTYNESQEKKENSVAINELNYFKEAIAGKHSESEISFYYTEKQLSTRGAEAIRYELTRPETEIDFKFLPVFLSVFEKDPVLLGQLVARPEVPLNIKLKVADNPKSRAVLPMAENTHTPPSVLLKLANYDQK